MEGRSRMKRILNIDPRKLLIVTENHGGYLGIRCALCDAAGWDGKIEHERKCLIKDIISITQEAKR
jgi:hypothetical protein